MNKYLELEAQFNSFWKISSIMKNSIICKNCNQGTFTKNQTNDKKRLMRCNKCLKNYNLIEFFKQYIITNNIIDYTFRRSQIGLIAPRSAAL